MKKAISYVMLFSILLSFVAVFPLQVKADEPTTELEKFVVKLNGYLDPALQLSVDGDKLVSNHNDPYGEKYVVQPDFDNNAITVLCSGPSQDSQYVPDNVGIQVEYSSETGASVTALGDIEIEGAVDKVEAPVFEAATTSSNYAPIETPVVHEYTITWVVDGNSTEEVYTEGSMPSYKGATPTKAATAEYTYTFIGWDSPLTEVTGDKTYTATFSNTNIFYTIEWVVDGNSSYQTLPYNSTEPLSHEAPTKEGYTFIGWSPDVSAVTGNAIYTAQFERIIPNVVIHNTSDGTGTYTRAVYADRVEVVLTGHPKNGKSFLRWTITGNYTIVSGSLEDEELTIIAKGDIEVTPSFRTISYGGHSG